MSKLKTGATDGVFTITLDDPPANTYSYEMMRELDDAVLQARLDAGVQGLKANLEKRKPNFSGR